MFSLGRLWFLILPLMFVPNFGFIPETGFGTLEISDFLMVIFIPLIFLSKKSREHHNYGRLYRVGSYFVAWAMFSILCIPVFYHYTDYIKPTMFSALKLAKFVLYAGVGALITSRLHTERNLRSFMWGLLTAGVILGTGLIASYLLKSFFGVVLYKSANQASVTLSSFMVFLTVLYFQGWGSAGWRFMCGLGLVIMALGLTFSQGRAGMAAYAILIAFYIGTHRPKFKQIALVVVVALGSLILYEKDENFQKEINNTFFRDEAYLKKYNAGVGGVDDGARLSTWAHEAPKIINAPIIGTGFHHRGGKSGLWSTGSHNFWLQIFLETGVIGGFLFIYVMFVAYRQGVVAKKRTDGDPRLAKAFTLAIFAVIVGNLSGEYLVGGTGLLCFLMIYAPIGALPRLPREELEAMMESFSEESTSNGSEENSQLLEGT
jgi:O-antigen ligase